MTATVIPASVGSLLVLIDQLDPAGLVRHVLDVMTNGGMA